MAGEASTTEPAGKQLTIDEIFDMMQGTLLNIKGYIKNTDAAYLALLEENKSLKGAEPKAE